MSSDLTFITNEQGRTLGDRFTTLIKDSKFFDCLVGYFFTSGFYRLYEALENTERIRILIGIGTNRETFELIRQGQVEANKQGEIQFSHAETKDEYGLLAEQEMENLRIDAKSKKA